MAFSFRDPSSYLFEQVLPAEYFPAGYPRL